MPIYVALDCETTGLYPLGDEIIELGAVRFDRHGAVLATTTSLVYADRPCSPRAEATHGITRAMIDAAPRPEDVLPAFREFLGHHREVVLLAHNARVDLAFLRVAFARHSLPALAHESICTLAESRRKWPRFESYRLEALADRLGIPGDDGHRALADAERVRLLWKILNR